MTPRSAPDALSLRRMTNEELVDRFEAACSMNNEMDNRVEVEGLRREVLRRMLGWRPPQPMPSGGRRL